MNIWRVQLFNWEKSCDHQGSLLGGWVCAHVYVFLLIRVPLCLRRSKLPEFIKMMSEHFVWWSSNRPGDQSNTALSSAWPINRSGTLAKSVWSATWLSSYVVFSIVSLCRELWTLHLKWTGRSSGAPPPLWRIAGASDARWRKATDNSLWNCSTSCFISIPWLHSCVYTCRYVYVHAAHVRTYMCVLVGENVIKMEENISVISVISVKGRRPVRQKSGRKEKNQYLKSGSH